MGKSGRSALAGVQRQLVGQLVKYRRTTRLRLNKRFGDDPASPLPAALVDSRKAPRASPVCVHQEGADHDPCRSHAHEDREN